MNWIEKIVLKYIQKRVNKHINNMKKSWKTTIVGVATFIGLVAAQSIALFDGDPQTSFSLEAIIAAFGALGLGWNAKDEKEA